MVGHGAPISNVFSTQFLTLTWHSLFGAIAVFAAVYCTDRWGQQVGFRKGIVADVALWAVISGLIGARIVAVADDWTFYSQNPLDILKVWQGGIAIYGAFAGGVIGGSVYAFLKRYPVRYLLDLAAPSLVLAQAIGRIGDIINGDHYSTPSHLPWAVVYTNPASPGRFGPYGPLTPTHPAVAYELLAGVAAFGLLLFLRGRLKPAGALFAVTAALYAGIRLAFSFIRLDSHSHILGLNQQGFISVVVLAGAFLTLVLLRPRFGPRDCHPPAGFQEATEARPT